MHGFLVNQSRDYVMHILPHHYLHSSVSSLYWNVEMAQEDSTIIIQSRISSLQTACSKPPSNKTDKEYNTYKWKGSAKITNRHIYIRTSCIYTLRVVHLTWHIVHSSPLHHPFYFVSSIMRVPFNLLLIC